ncbi:hypothetical protein BBO99_00007030 [Phytophthora kernoviae]|uniref:Tc3 transposase DNA binding domain-containing protein n=2 Tax=Phytophthora kernoviae TaxID=325452 RepID=A0A421GIY5_9STRA|nr:hypothetical protein G195_003577 [Phytophthora kernoviae 00238/432]KAG2521317.1 hypothetical protein JM18_006660 [Phytophthora kernoviae]KAG2522255.1 hypothetical protein JM16_002235 [Phytophthora kernoviae]RLN44159.1 hypothetical protein BBI17_002622 [Phytophthora kernoviae]RLN77086.1 hypothetical protein BBO99_00007030 [Phytophthora kernoviae]
MGATEPTPGEYKNIFVLRDAGLRLSTILEATNCAIGVCHKVINLQDTPTKPSRRGKLRKVTERDKRSIIQRLRHDVSWLKFKKVRAGSELLPRHQTARKK